MRIILIIIIILFFSVSCGWLARVLVSYCVCVLLYHCNVVIYQLRLSDSILCVSHWPRRTVEGVSWRNPPLWGARLSCCVESALRVILTWEKGNYNLQLLHLFSATTRHLITEGKKKTHFDRLSRKTKGTLGGKFMHITTSLKIENIRHILM